MRRARAEGPSDVLRDVAEDVVTELEEHLGEWIKIPNMRAFRSSSVPTVRRAITWLRKLGAPIETGYRIEERGYRMPRAWSLPEGELSRRSLMRRLREERRR